jgi:diacylglycerol kinase family enzyme
MNPRSGGGKVARFGLKDKAEALEALVAGIAAEHDLPFLVISAGTRNHFALDLGSIGGRTFVNNASFGAYAEIVESPAYRDDKRGTTLQVLPDLLSGHRGATLTARAGAATITGPQTLPVRTACGEPDGHVAHPVRAARQGGEQ